MEQSTGTRKRKDALRGPGIDDLYQRASDGQGADDLLKKSLVACKALVYLIEHGEAGGEVEKLLLVHLAGDIDHERDKKAQAIGGFRRFFDECSPMDKDILAVSANALGRPGIGLYIGKTEDGRIEVEPTRAVNRKAG